MGGKCRHGKSSTCLESVGIRCSREQEHEGETSGCLTGLAGSRMRSSLGTAVCRCQRESRLSCRALQTYKHSRNGVVGCRNLTEQRLAALGPHCCGRDQSGIQCTDHAGRSFGRCDPKKNNEPIGPSHHHPVLFSSTAVTEERKQRKKKDATPACRTRFGCQLPLVVVRFAPPVRRRSGSSSDLAIWLHLMPQREHCCTKPSRAEMQQVESPSVRTGVWFF